MEQDIKRLKEKINNIKKYNTYRYDWTEIDIQTVEHLIKAYKELEEELKEEKELNKIIKNTKLDELFTTPRRNGKTIELAMQLREEILKLPECKLYGIKNCKNKVVLLTKEECIPVSLVKEKIEEYKQRIEKYNEYKKQEIETDVEFHKNITNTAIVKVLQELLEKE